MKNGFLCPRSLWALMPLDAQAGEHIKPGTCKTRREKWICEQRRSSYPLGCEGEDGCGENWNHLIQWATSFAWCIISKALPCKCLIMLIQETFEWLSGVNLYMHCQPMRGPKSLSIRWHLQYTDSDLEIWIVFPALRPESSQHIA